MTMQTLVIAHAAFGHNHFFKNNYMVPAMDQCRKHSGISRLRKRYIVACEERHGHARSKRCSIRRMR